MNILKHELISLPNLLASLKQTRLKGHGQPLIYANAHLTLEKAVDPNILIPAQRYVLQSDFRTIEHLYQTFLEKSIDIFSLTGGLLFWREEPETGLEEGPIPLTPPIVEVSLGAGGRKVWLISDGMHRVYTARQLGKRINIILVQQVPMKYPYYAYPLENGWADVIELAELPDGFQKKAYRESNYKELFRNYNEVFPGIQKQRKRTNPVLSG
jgi:hypothetical protein